MHPPGWSPARFRAGLPTRVKRTDARRHLDHHGLGALVLRRVREPDVEITFGLLVGMAIRAFASLELHGQEIANNGNGALFLRLDRGKSLRCPFVPVLLADVRRRIEAG